MLKVNDFFCGAGGMGLGFKNAGFDIAGAWDFDKWAVQSYAHNVGGHVQQADISKLHWNDIPYAEVWTFGFPCQDVSIAGKQRGMIKGQTRSGLFYEIMRLLEETEEHAPEFSPKIIMAENVKAVFKHLPLIQEEYEALGYRMYFKLLKSSHFGVPQARERYFIVGVHQSIDAEFVFPEGDKTNIPKLKSVLEDNVDSMYYIDDLRATKIIEEAKEGLRVKQATKKGYDVAVEGDSINTSHPNSKTRRGRVGKQVAQTLLTGQEQLVVERDLHVIGRIEYNGHDILKRVYDIEGLSPTLTAVKGGYQEAKILSGLRVRKLTEREYARLQGFPESFEIVVSKSQAYKQFGNAVTVTVAEAIAKEIKNFLMTV